MLDSSVILKTPAGLKPRKNILHENTIWLTDLGSNKGTLSFRKRSGDRWDHDIPSQLLHNGKPNWLTAHHLYIWTGPHSASCSSHCLFFYPLKKSLSENSGDAAVTFHLISEYDPVVEDAKEALSTLTASEKAISGIITMASLN